MMVTWTFVACCLWDALFHPGRRIFFQSKKEADAAHLVERARFIYDHLPQAVKDLYPVNPPAYCKLEFGKWNSIIQGIPQGADVLRQYTASRVFCIGPETKVLTVSLKWIRADQVKKGDCLAGFTEENGDSGKKSDGLSRKREWRKSKVLDVVTTVRPSYRLTFNDGTVVVCSAEHRWLVGYKQGWHWLTTEKLRQRGDSQHTGKGWAGSKVVRLSHVWGDDNSYAAGYLAAAFDGEGNFRQKKYDRGNFGIGSHVALAVSQNENAMLDEIIRMLKQKEFDTTRMRHVFKGYTAVHHTIHIRTRPEIMRFLGQVRPKRLLQKVDLDQWGTAVSVCGVELMKKEFIGDTRVIGFKTDTGTFLAEGLASHNSDEMAFQEKAEEAFVAARPTITGGGSFVGVSSPNGKNFFYLLKSDKI